MRYRSLLPRDLFAELARLQHDLQLSPEWSPNIRGGVRGGYPAVNVGHTASAVEIYAFAPGLDPASIDLQLEKTTLIVAGERKGPPNIPEEKSVQHIDERFTGRFRRVVNLPDDIDPNAVQARYRDGVLHISVQRRSPAQPRRIAVH